MYEQAVLDMGRENPEILPDQSRLKKDPGIQALQDERFPGAVGRGNQKGVVDIALAVGLDAPYPALKRKLSRSFADV
jgi:hypothetical protein